MKSVITWRNNLVESSVVKFSLEARLCSSEFSFWACAIDGQGEIAIWRVSLTERAAIDLSNLVKHTIWVCGRAAEGGNYDFEHQIAELRYDWDAFHHYPRLLDPNSEWSQICDSHGPGTRPISFLKRNPRDNSCLLPPVGDLRLQAVRGVRHLGKLRLQIVGGVRGADLGRPGLPQCKRENGLDNRSARQNTIGPIRHDSRNVAREAA